MSKILTRLEHREGNKDLIIDCLIDEIRVYQCWRIHVPYIPYSLGRETIDK